MEKVEKVGGTVTASTPSLVSRDSSEARSFDYSVWDVTSIHHPPFLLSSLLFSPTASSLASNNKLFFCRAGFGISFFPSPHFTDIVQTLKEEADQRAAGGQRSHETPPPSFPARSVPVTSGR